MPTMGLPDEQLASTRQTVGGLPDMDDQQFARWVDLLERRTGMAMPPERKSFLVTSVGLRMRELGFEDFDAYYRHLTSGVAGNLEWSALVDRLTVHETRFFRDPRAMDYVREALVPELVSRGQDSLNVWSVGCATGEEAYTLGMVVANALQPYRQPPHFGITATDISLHALGVGRQGVYSLRRLADIPEADQARYCEIIPVQRRFRIVSELRRRVGFGQMNVLDVDRSPSLGMDLVFCQNLLIYFDQHRRQAIVDGLARHLRPGGTLILGAGEYRGRPAGLWRPDRTGDVLAFRRPMTLGATDDQ